MNRRPRLGIPSRGRSFHFHTASFFGFMAANLSFTQFVRGWRAEHAFDASREEHKLVTCGYAVSFLNVTTNAPLNCVDVPM